MRVLGSCHLPGTFLFSKFSIIIISYKYIHVNYYEFHMKMQLKKKYVILYTNYLFFIKEYMLYSNKSIKGSEFYQEILEMNER